MFYSLNTYGIRIVLRFVGMLLFCCALTSPVSAQTESPAPSWKKLSEMEDSLKLYGLSMVRDSTYEVRRVAQANFSRLFSEALALEGSFDYPFDSVKTISILYPKDRTFRIFTWQVCENSNKFHYYGQIQMNTPKGERVVLTDHSESIPVPQQEILDAEHWYGALYYDIQEIGKGKKKYYLLYGFDANDLFQRRKLVEVLKFKDGKPVFGAPIFITRMRDGNALDVAKRFVLNYGATTSVSLRYDYDLKMIIYDNLIPFGSPYAEANYMMLPDGSYRGFVLKKNKWHPIEKVFHQTQDEAPREMPILDGRKGKHGLFGPEN